MLRPNHWILLHMKISKLAIVVFFQNSTQLPLVRITSAAMIHLLLFLYLYRLLMIKRCRCMLHQKNTFPLIHQQGLVQILKIKILNYRSKNLSKNRNKYLSTNQVNVILKLWLELDRLCNDKFSKVYHSDQFCN